MMASPMSSRSVIRPARGGIVAILLLAAACSGGDGATTTTSGGTAGGGISTTEPVTTSSAATPATTQSTSTATTATSSSTATAADGAFDVWITVLASLPTSEYDEAGAEEVAGATHAQARLLLSDDFPSLKPGFWVVYLGEHEYEWEAAAACPGSVPDCYARYLAAIGQDSPVGADTATALAVADTGELVVLSVTTGELVWALDRPVGGDGSFPGPMTLGSDGLSAFYSVGFEDYWFSCDASDGTLMQLDLTGGDSVQVGDGLSPDVSPDGASLLYLAASSCFPDPAEPQFVLAPIDTIVRRDLATGAEAKLTVEPAGDVNEGYELWSTVWGADGEVFVLDSQGGLWRHGASDDPGRWLVDGELIASLEAQSELVGFDASRDLLLYAVQQFDEDQPTTFLNGVDIESGATVPVDSFAAAASFALDLTGTRLLTASEGTIDSAAGRTTIDFNVWQLAW